jgi:hypothetical protein
MCVRLRFLHIPILILILKTSIVHLLLVHLVLTCPILGVITETELVLVHLLYPGLLTTECLGSDFVHRGIVFLLLLDLGADSAAGLVLS